MNADSARPSATLVGYTSPVMASRVLAGLLAVGASLNIVGAWSTQSQVALLQGVQRGEMASEAIVVATDGRQRLIELLQLAAYLPSVLLFLVWIDRVYSNLRAFSPRPLSFGQRWAVGAWFVPLVNVVRPFQIVREAWWISASPAAAALALPGFRPVAPTWLYAWWAMFLGVGLTSRLAAMNAQRATSVTDLITASQMWLVHEVVTGVAALLAIRVVTRISTDQERAVLALMRR